MQPLKTKNNALILTNSTPSIGLLKRDLVPETSGEDINVFLILTVVIGTYRMPAIENIFHCKNRFA